MSKSLKKIAKLSMRTIHTLALPYLSEQDLYIGNANIKHMQTKHPQEYAIYSDHMLDIIRNPDYVTLPRKDGSFRLIKEFPERVLIAVRPTKKGKHLVIRSMYKIKDDKFESYKKAGTLKEMIPSADVDYI